MLVALATVSVAISSPVRRVGTGSDDNKSGGILKSAEHVLKKLFTTALWVFATDNTLDVKRV